MCVYIYTYKRIKSLQCSHFFVVFFFFSFCSPETCFCVVSTVGPPNDKCPPLPPQMPTPSPLNAHPLPTSSTFMLYTGNIF